jgi:RNA polymerase sigma-70 factor, ECF subfamily
MEYERFTALVTPHLGAMARVAAAFVGLADAEDAAQEALIRAWNGWASLREEKTVGAWLLRITANVCHNWQGGRFGTQQRLTVPLESLFESISGHAVPPTIDSRDVLEPAAFDLRSAIARLPRDLRQVLALRFFVGMDSTEISATLDILAGTVRTRLQRAMTLLRQSLGDDEENECSRGEPSAGGRRP